MEHDYALVAVYPDGRTEILSRVQGQGAEKRAHDYAKTIALPDRATVKVYPIGPLPTLYVGLDGKCSTDPEEVGLPSGDMPLLEP